MEKTIVVLIGNARGGEKTWNTMYNNLLEPYRADLALCFGYSKDKSSSLYSNAKYVWEIPEYEKWEEYYIGNLGDNGWWKKSFELGINSGFSGLYGSRGSGAIFCVFKHYLLNNKRSLLESYDRIIITRADYFYLKPVEVLSNDYFWVPSGADYGGLCDRYHSFSSSDIDMGLGIVDYYINTNQLTEDYVNFENINLESSYYYYFKRHNYLNKVKRFPRVQMLVRTVEDSYRWHTSDIVMPHNDDIYVKYQDEYDECMKTIFTSYNRV
jgi:hypothetical protein